jgi:hypothetical protein
MLRRLNIVPPAKDLLEFALELQRVLLTFSRSHIHRISKYHRPYPEITLYLLPLRVIARIAIAEKIIIKIQHLDRFRIKNVNTLDFKIFVFYYSRVILIKIILALR